MTTNQILDWYLISIKNSEQEKVLEKIKKLFQENGEKVELLKNYPYHLSRYVFCGFSIEKEKKEKFFFLFSKIFEANFSNYSPSLKNFTNPHPIFRSSKEKVIGILSDQEKNNFFKNKEKNIKEDKKHLLETKYRKGDTVRILEGPFSEKVGKIKKILDKDLTISISLFEGIESLTVIPAEKCKRIS